jgi:hypothetical protein
LRYLRGAGFLGEALVEGVVPQASSAAFIDGAASASSKKPRLVMVVFSLRAMIAWPLPR